MRNGAAERKRVQALPAATTTVRFRPSRSRGDRGLIQAAWDEYRTTKAVQPGAAGMMTVVAHPDSDDPEVPGWFRGYELGIGSGDSLVTTFYCLESINATNLGFLERQAKAPDDNQPRRTTAKQRQKALREAKRARARKGKANAARR